MQIAALADVGHHDVAQAEIDTARAQRELLLVMFVSRLHFALAEILGQRARVPQGIVGRRRKQQLMHAGGLALRRGAIEPILPGALALIPSLDALVLRGVGAALRRARFVWYRA